MENLKNISSELLKIEKSLHKAEKKHEIEIEELFDVEEILNRYFNLLDEIEEELLTKDMKDNQNRKNLLQCANCVSVCDRIWHEVKRLKKEKDEEEEMNGRDVWDILYPDQDINSSDFEVGEYDEN